MAAGLRTKILEEIDFKVDETHFRSDSEIVLHYLNNTQRRFSVYVSHRVAEIVSKSDVIEWLHIPGTMNVADDCTRGKEIQELTLESRWISSPLFLMLHEGEWLSSKEDLHVNENELQVRALVLTMFFAPSMIVVEWEMHST